MTTWFVYGTTHLQMNVLCSSLNSEEMLQNFLYLFKKKTQVVFFRFFIFRATFIFSFMNALVYVDIDKGIHKGPFANDVTQFLTLLVTLICSKSSNAWK